MRKIDTKNLRSVLRWREDIASGEIIEARNYTKSYWSASSGLISQDELDMVCKVANKWWELCNSKLRVVNSMGEIRPARRREKTLTFDFRKKKGGGDVS